MVGKKVFIKSLKINGYITSITDNIIYQVQFQNPDTKEYSYIYTDIEDLKLIP